MTQQTLSITGMSCASCVGSVESAILNTEGVDKAVVNLATNQTTLIFDETTITLDRIITSVESAGYGVAEDTATFAVGEMSCAACVSRVASALEGVPGVRSASVNLATGVATVRHTNISVVSMTESVIAAGYSIATETQTAAAEQSDDLQQKLIVSGILSAGIVGVGMGAAGDVLPETWIAPFLALLALPVQIWCGWPFLSGFFSALRHRSANMNSLVAVGTLSAYGYSLVITAHAALSGSIAGHIYFDTAAMIITFVLLGRFLEHRARSRTSDAIRQLMDLQPDMARVVRNGETVEVALSEVVIEDRLRVLPGDRIPVDGKIVEGHSSVDESLITGESMPIEKETGDVVTGGSINTTGAFLFKATAVGKDTALARIVTYVEEAQASRPPIQRLADRIAAVFVPIVFGIAAATFLGWWLFTGSFSSAMVSAVSVLIISCPCALGLATPTAILVGTGQGAKSGILIRGGEAVETAQAIHTIVFDKTGTLTYGRPVVTDIIPTADKDEREVLLLAASLEQDSEHPIAQAILEKSRHLDIELFQTENFEAVPGGGIRATLSGSNLLLGSRRFLTREGCEDIDDRGDRLLEEGKTTVYLSQGGRLVGIIGVADELRSESREAIGALRQMGIEVAMITGDNIRTAEAVARQIDVDLVVADVLPEQKANRIVALQQQKGVVAMVGDGINDAPALAQADIGIAIGTGTDIAIESADVALTSGDLRGVPGIIRLSRQTMRIIKQNLFWAFAYNVILIPVAAAGVLTPWGGPMLAAGAMAFSSVTVVSNALRLKRFNLER
jgi:Cu+-exporting ATPase